MASCSTTEAFPMNKYKKNKKSSPCTRIKAFVKTGTCMVTALLLLEELVEQYAELSYTCCKNQYNPDYI
jgi:hypothetical protein